MPDARQAEAAAAANGPVGQPGAGEDAKVGEEPLEDKAGTRIIGDADQVDEDVGESVADDTSPRWVFWSVDSTMIPSCG